MRPTLNVNLSQRLAMTPSLLQKIELLTLNQLELSDLMNQELAENPFLEEIAEGAEGESRDKREEEKSTEQKEEQESLDEFDYEYFFGEYLTPVERRREYDQSDDRPSFELFLASTYSLADHLIWQLTLTEADPVTREVAEFIIGNIDEDGYLTLSLEEVAASMGVSLEQAQRALDLVQSLDPLGVGARDLQECLLLQLRALELDGSLAEKMVKECLPLLETRKYREIARQLNCTLEEVAAALETLRRLSPKPGQKYNTKEPQYIRPDVYLYKVGDEYQILLNDDGLPRLRLNRAYRRLLLKGSEVSKDTKSFVKERFRSALELLRSIDQRQQTIYRVCGAIIQRQRDFLEKGPLFLKPMLIKDVAEELGVHPSTISRVVSNKYAHTPQGVMELRKFFTVGVESADGENVSTVHVKETIRKIIEEENPKKPLSDQKISKILNQQGIQITRRTVAKYRDQMNIAGSRERKMMIPR